MSRKPVEYPARLILRGCRPGWLDHLRNAQQGAFLRPYVSRQSVPFKPDFALTGQFVVSSLVYRPIDKEEHWNFLRDPCAPVVRPKEVREEDSVAFPQSNSPSM